MMIRIKKLAGALAIAVLSLSSAGTMSLIDRTPSFAGEPTASVIVQGPDVETLAGLVADVGGEVTHELAIINAIVADLTVEQRAALQEMESVVRISENHVARTAAASDGDRRSRKRRRSSYSTTLTSGDGSSGFDPESSSASSDDSSSVADGGANSSEESSSTTSYSGSGYSGSSDSGSSSEEPSSSFSYFGTESSHYDTFPELAGASRVHQSGITGDDVTIAFLDTGLVSWFELSVTSSYKERILAQYDAVNDRELSFFSGWDSDENGHGTHMAAIAGSDGMDGDRKRFHGIAPHADLVMVKAFGSKGEGSYANVIRGIEWVVKNKDRLNIRVLNLSFSAPVRSHYWDDPVNQAVMRAWQEGIFVVASAGNSGPSPMTIGVPGNVPYVLTVGAMTDSYTPDDRSDDRLTTFSAAGPTAERFVKPDVLAPGGHITALMDLTSHIAETYPEFHDSSRYFTMSGTSQAAAIASGLAALVLQSDPSLTPDDLKCRLMAGAHPAVDADGNLGYSVFQQGSGLVNAYDAVFNEASGCANVGLDVAADIAGKAHFAGPTRIDADGRYYVEGFEHSLATGSFLWNNSMLWNTSFLWSNSMLWNNSFLWNNSMLWNNSFLWSNSELFSDSFLWNNSMLWNNSDLKSDSFLWSNTLGEPMNINSWVKPE